MGAGLINQGPNIGAIHVVGLTKRSTNLNQSIENRTEGAKEGKQKTTTIEFGRIPGFNGTMYRNKSGADKQQFGQYELQPLKKVDKFREYNKFQPGASSLDTQIPSINRKDELNKIE